jgi:hypothetical protein
VIALAISGTVLWVHQIKSAPPPNQSLFLH